MSWVLLLFQATDRKTGRERISLSQGCIPSKESCSAQSQCFLPAHPCLWVQSECISQVTARGTVFCLCSEALALALSPLL